MASEITKSSCKVSWDPPDYDGGTPVLHYVLQVRDGDMILGSAAVAEPQKELFVYLFVGNFISVALCSGGRPAGGRMST